MKAISKVVVDSTLALTELCILGMNAGTDKSPHNTRSHRHPYTAVYTMLLAPLKTKEVRFAEIGIAVGSSAVMWSNFFTHPHARLQFYDRDEELFKHVTERCNGDERCTSALMDVAVDGDVKRALDPYEALRGGSNGYDVIIDDSSHEHGHQIRIIKEAFPLLKSGGMLIIEDVFRSTPEDEYAREIPEILDECAAAFFVECEHVRKWSPGWDNDKLLVLVRA